MKKNYLKTIIGILVLCVLLTGCGKNSDYVGTYRQISNSKTERIIEVNKKGAARLYDAYDTLTGEWDVTDTNVLEMALTELGTELYYAKFPIENNKDIIKVFGGFYGENEDDAVYFVRKDSDSYKNIDWDNVDQFLATIPGVIVDTKDYNEDTNTQPEVVDDGVEFEVVEEDEQGPLVPLSIENYKNDEITINGEKWDEFLETAQKQSEDVLTASCARSFSSTESLVDKNYLGYYVLSPKSKDYSGSSFILYTIYYVTVNNDKDGDFSYYWYCGFKDPIAIDSNCYSIDLSKYDEPFWARCETPSTYYYYHGYDSINSLFHNVVAVAVDDYNYDENVTTDITTDTN